MSLTLLITIIIVTICVAILVVGIIRDNGDMAFGGFLLTVITAIFGFGLACGVIPSSTNYTKLDSTVVEYKYYEKFSRIIMMYDDTIYYSSEIKDLNSMHNLDYFVFEEDINGYGVVVKTKLHIVEKGKVDDYIEKAFK